MKAPADNVEQIIENITSSRMRRIGYFKAYTMCVLWEMITIAICI